MGLDMYVYRGTPEERARKDEERYRIFEEETADCFEEEIVEDRGTYVRRHKPIKRGKKAKLHRAQEKLWASREPEFWYWRKHPNLHGWMERLWEEKGLAEGKEDNGWGTAFNGEPVPLTEEDLLRLKADIEADALPFTMGFFFGHSDGSEREEDLKFVEAALEALRSGESLYYDSSW